MNEKTITQNYYKEWRLKNPEKVKASQRKHYYNNVKKMREKSIIYARNNKEEHLKAALRWNKENPEKYKLIKQRYRNKNLQKHREWNRKYAEKNKDKLKIKYQEYRKKPGVKEHYQEYMRNWNLRLREKLVGSPKPNQCPVCGRKPVGGKSSKGRICIDHCHKTNKIRGWLCDDCNSALGRVDDRIDILENLIIYLKKFL